MSSQKSFFEAILRSLFLTLAMNRGISMDVSVNRSTDSNSTAAVIGTVKLFDAAITICSAFWRMLHGRAPLSVTGADLFVIGYIKVDDDFAWFPNPHPYHYAEKCGIPSSIGNIRLSVCYAWDIHVKISRCPVRSSGEKVPLHDGVQSEVTEMEISLNDVISEITNTAARKTKLEVANYSHDDLLLRVN